MLERNLDQQHTFNLNETALKPTEVAWIITVRTEPTLAVLAARRKDSDLITFPGGKLKPDEPPIEAVVREFEEETSLRISPDQVFSAGKPVTLLTTEGYFIKAHPYFCFFGSVSDQTLTTTEPAKHSSWTWYTFPEIVDSVLHNKLPSGLDTKFIDQILECIYEAEYDWDANPFLSHISYL